MNLSILEQLLSQENDYSVLETSYLHKRGRSLVRNPLESLSRDAAGRASVSIVIPAWNVASSLPRCLLSISHSDYVVHYPEDVQVVIVDDGSTDGTAESISHLRLSFETLLIKQTHRGRAYAMNTGLACAKGDVLISCDADMVLSPLAISELVQRVEGEPRALYFGFRRDISGNDYRVSADMLKQQIPSEAFEFWHDNRYTYHWDGHSYPGWPKNIMAASTHAKRLGKGRCILLADGDFWSLPKMVYGALFGLHRSWLAHLGGFDERFVGWGYEDTFFAAKAIAAGMFIVPAPSVTGIHLSHPPRSGRQWEDATRNRSLLNSLVKHLGVEHKEQKAGSFQNAIVTGNKLTPRTGEDRVVLRFREDVHRRSLEPAWRIRYLAAQARWSDAACLVPSLNASDLSAHAPICAEILRRCGDLNALQHLRVQLSSYSIEVEIQYSFALYEKGQSSTASQIFQAAVSRNPSHPEIKYILRGGPRKHLRRAYRYSELGFEDLALEDGVAAFLSGACAGSGATQFRGRISRGRYKGCQL